MAERTYPKFKDEYRRLLWSLTNDQWSVEERNERTGHMIRSMLFGTTLYVDLTDGILPTIDCRKTFPRSAAAETAWYVLGTRKTDFIDRYAKRLWDKFKEADGRVAAAYGWRWREAFGRDQLWLAVQALHKNPSDRRVWISAWDPTQDGLGAEGQKNVPCPVGFSFSIVDGRLNSTLVLRSSDVFVGLPYDVMGHAMLMGMVASSLGGVSLGVMTVTLAHPHLYDSHYDMAHEALRTVAVAPQLRIPTTNLTDVRHDPDAYVAQWKELQATAFWNGYSPVPEVIE